jgi:hypothetical protein
MTMDLPEVNIDEPRKRIAVLAAPVDFDSGTAPGPQVAAGSQVAPGQERILAALECVFPVRFERVDSTDLNRLDGGLVFGPGLLAKTPAGFPRLVLPASTEQSDSRGQRGRADASVASGRVTPVILADEPGLARPLRGRAIPESAVAGELPLDLAGGRVLAEVAGRPVWQQIGAAAAALGVSAYPLSGLRDGETLRDHLRAGCFMGLLPLVHFLGQVLGAGGWRLPPLRASFVIDDPNLHWPSYGFLNYRELAAHAVRNSYHVGLATVPLDGWLVDRRVASLLARNSSALSLLVHGNDHVARELGRLSTDAEAEPVIAQALRRIAALERRHGVTVERVMVPPYEACSEAALRAMFRFGIEAACHTRPYPWREDLPAATPLAGWHPAELVAGGLPVLPRYPLGAPREDLALWALLGQPLILYGHHGDFAQGLDILAQAASEIDGLGDVQWGPLGWIARGSYSSRRLGEMLLVRMHARRIAVGVPAGVRALRIVLQEPLGGAAGHRLTLADGSLGIGFDGGLGVSELLAVDAPARIELTLMADRPLSPAQVRSRGIRPWPLIRRALVEGRDRTQALRYARPSMSGERVKRGGRSGE